MRAFFLIFESYGVRGSIVAITFICVYIVNAHDIPSTKRWTHLHCQIIESAFEPRVWDPERFISKDLPCDSFTIARCGLSLMYSQWQNPYFTKQVMPFKQILLHVFTDTIGLWSIQNMYSLNYHKWWMVTLESVKTRQHVGSQYCRSTVR